MELRNAHVETKPHLSMWTRLAHCGVKGIVWVFRHKGIMKSLPLNIMDVKVLVDWQSPVLEVLLWFWGISGSFQGCLGSKIKNKYIYKTNVIRIVDLYLQF